MSVTRQQVIFDLRPQHRSQINEMRERIISGKSTQADIEYYKRSRQLRKELRNQLRSIDDDIFYPAPLIPRPMGIMEIVQEAIKQHLTTISRER